MRTRRQVVFFALTWITAALAVVVLVAELKPERTAPKPTVALRYDLDAKVIHDGSMRVVETFRYRFDRDRVQLKRVYAADGQVPTQWAVLRDGEPERFSFDRSGDRYLLVVGDGSPSSRGIHEYQFRYTVPGVLREAAGGTTRGFRQQLVSAGFAARIVAGRVTVTFPGAVRHAICRRGDARVCIAERIRDRKIAIALRDLPPRTSVEVTAVVGAISPSGPSGSLDSPS